MYLAMTSGRLKGEDVYNSGFANYYVSKDNVGKIYEEIASNIRSSKNPRETIESILGKYHIGKPNQKIANEE